MLAIVIALISLTLTILMYMEVGGLLLPALASYAALAALIYWGNKHVFLVPHGERRDG